MSGGFMPAWFRKKSDEEEPTNFGLARVFKHEELKKATNSFTTELGVGGFGSVYLGTLTDGRKVAVKLLHNHNPKRLQQFVNEVIVLSSLRHKNLVTLHGCTNPRGKELFLVYDYVPNSTVDDHLHFRRSDLQLAIRVQIAMETAEALVYLHAHDPPLIHRDVKTPNVMLDDGFHVKLCDLGLCRLLPWDSTQVLTEAQGTLGYRDPEYDRTCILTVKSDVYSFGMMLVELLTGQMVVDVNRPPGNIYLADFALNKIVNKKLDDIVDPKLGYNNNTHHKRVINSLAELAVKCLHQTGIKRPTMEQVLTELKNIDNELQEKQVLNANLINGASRITCLIQRFRAAGIVPLMIILCCLWYGMSYCKAKEEGGENSGTSLIACLIRRTCITVSLMIILCCLWHFRRHCTSMIRSLVELYSVVVKCFIYNKAHLKLQAENEGGEHSGTNMIASLITIYSVVVFGPKFLIEKWYRRAKEEGGEHSSTGMIRYLLTIYCVVVDSAVVDVPLNLISKWYGKHSGTSWITHLKKTYLTILFLFFELAVALCLVPLVLISCCLFFRLVHGRLLGPGTTQY